VLITLGPDGSTLVTDYDFGFFKPSLTPPGTGTPGYWKNHPEAWTLDPVIVGGVGSTVGVIMGAILLTLMPEMFRFINDYKLLVYGGLLLFVMRFSPGGTAVFTAVAQGSAGNAANATSTAVTVQTPPVLSVTSVTILPVAASIGQTMTMYVTVQNVGGATATGVSPPLSTIGVTCAPSGLQLK